MTHNITSLAFTVILALTSSQMTGQTHLDIEVSGQTAPISIKNDNSIGATVVNINSNDDKLFQIGVTGSNNTFFGQGNVPYFFTSLNSFMPIVFATEGTERMRLNHQGDLGIGLTNPSSRLHVKDGDLRVESGNAFVLGRMGVGSTDVSNKIFYVYSEAAFSTAAKIELNSAGANQHALNVTSNGSNAAVSIENTGTGRGINVDAGDRAIHATSSSGQGTIAAFNSGSGHAGDFTINNASSSQDAVVCETLGTGFALRVTSSNAADNGLFCNGDAYRADGQTTWNVISDKRLKTDIHDFHDGLDVVMAIRPRTFRYNGLGGMTDKGPQIGIVAQEIESVAPYTIQKHMMDLDPDDSSPDMTEVLSFNSSPLLFVMINAIRDLKQELDTKTAALDDMRADMQKLVARISHLEHQSRITAQADN